MLTFQRFFWHTKCVHAKNNNSKQQTYLGLIVVQKSYMGLSKKIINLNNSRHENIHFVQLLIPMGRLLAIVNHHPYVFFGAGGQPWNHWLRERLHNLHWDVVLWTQQLIHRLLIYTSNIFLHNFYRMQNIYSNVVCMRFSMGALCRHR